MHVDRGVRCSNKIAKKRYTCLQRGKKGGLNLQDGVFESNVLIRGSCNRIRCRSNMLWYHIVLGITRQWQANLWEQKRKKHRDKLNKVNPRSVRQGVMYLWTTIYGNVTLVWIFKNQKQNILGPYTILTHFFGPNFRLTVLCLPRLI